MPLNTSDKIDRQHLLQLYKDSVFSSSPRPQTPPPTRNSAASEVESESATGSETKTVLRQAWSQVLGVDASNISDNSSFVRLGGSSINAIKLVAVLRKQNVALNTTQILAHPVLLEQARLANSNSKQANGTNGPMRARTPEPFELL